MNTVRTLEASQQKSRFSPYIFVCTYNRRDATAEIPPLRSLDSRRIAMLNFENDDAERHCRSRRLQSGRATWRT
jgi:hypothetical protein